MLNVEALSLTAQFFQKFPAPWSYRVSTVGISLHDSRGQLVFFLRAGKCAPRKEEELAASFDEAIAFAEWLILMANEAR